jgi:tRNA A37 threonylcarbamoyladenosine modification protein TsaB
MARGHAERLLPLLAETLAEAGRGWADLDALAVCTGPGNFTGLRIGVAAARGLALALGRPAVGVDRFAALAEGQPGRVRIALDTGRGTVFAQDFRDGRAEGPPAAIAGPADPGPGLADPATLARIAAARLAAGAPLSPPAPLYLRPADADPAREPAPVLLDGP